MKIVVAMEDPLTSAEMLEAERLACLAIRMVMQIIAWCAPDAYPSHVGLKMQMRHVEPLEMIRVDIAMNPDPNS